MSTQIDATAKQAVRERLRTAAEQNLTAARERFEQEQSAAELDQDEAFSVDDLSQSDEAGALAGYTGDAIAQGEAALAAIDALDLGVTDVVRPGAFVTFGGGAYVVGVVAAPVEVDGVTYEGISTDSPAFAAIEGKRAGDAFTLNGVDHTLGSVV